MRLTLKQLQGLLKHKDSPFIRCIGFLYLRYTCDPEELWKYYEEFLDDPEEVNASATPNTITSIGRWVRGLLENLNYYGTLLPRIPKKIQDGLKVKLLLHDAKKDRKKRNLAIVHKLKKGVKIKAMYSDEENAPAMYDAKIDSIDEDNTYWVTFTEYGNSEKVDLGEIELLEPEVNSNSRRSRSRNRSCERRSSRRSRSRRSRSPSRSRSRSRRSDSRRSRGNNSHSSNLTDDLLAEVRRREREKAEAVGRDYASRPASYKGSLSLKADRFTTRKRSRSRTPPLPRHISRRRRSRSPSPPPPPSRKKTVDPEAQEKMRKLRERYGDAASQKR